MRKVKMAFLLLACGVLAACEQTYVPPRLQLTFTGVPYALNVASVEVVDEYRPSGKPPHVEKLADITPSEAVREWAASKLVAAGKSGRAELVIADAHIVKREIPKEKTGLSGYFTNEQTEAYDGGLEVDIKLYDEQHTLPVATIHALAQSSRTLAENATLVDRDNVYHEITAELMRLLEIQLDRNIQEHFANYLM